VTGKQNRRRAMNENLDVYDEMVNELLRRAFHEKDQLEKRRILNLATEIQDLKTPEHKIDWNNRKFYVTRGDSAIGN
jgi:hypothetical protein